MTLEFITFQGHTDHPGGKPIQGNLILDNGRIDGGHIDAGRPYIVRNGAQGSYDSETGLLRVYSLACPPCGQPTRLAFEIEDGQIGWFLDDNGRFNEPDLIGWYNLPNPHHLDSLTVAPLHMGDSNFSGAFDSGDFTQVFQRNQYEQGTAAFWEDGDWNGDYRFDSGDLTTAFVAGTYELPTAAVIVPECGSLLTVGLMLLALWWRKR